MIHTFSPPLCSASSWLPGVNQPAPSDFSTIPYHTITLHKLPAEQEAILSSDSSNEQGHPPHYVNLGSGPVAASNPLGHCESANTSAAVEVH